MKAGEKKKEDLMLMREVAPSSNSLLDNAESTAPPVVHQVLSESGQPLDAATREFMEARFHYDFSHVRVHTGARASDSAHAVCANAYTVEVTSFLRADNMTPALSLASDSSCTSWLIRFSNQRSRRGRLRL